MAPNFRFVHNINAFVASHFYYAVFYNVFGQTTNVISTAFSPFTVYFCYFQEFIRGVMAFQLIQLFTFIFTSKYFYIFIFKNPAGIKEDFWCFFLNIWSLLISCITQFIYEFMPGRNHINFYFCSGTFDISLANEKVKQNYAFIGYLTLAVIWYFYAAVKIHRYQQNIIGVPVVCDSIQDSQTAISLLLKETFKNSLVNVAMIAVLLSILLLYAAIRAYLNTLDLELLNRSPNYQLFQFTDHGFTVVNYVCVIIIYYFRNSVMRQTIFREIKDNWLEVKEYCCLH
jgi:hypothetical protein